MQQKSILNAIKKAPNLKSCKMAAVLKKKQETSLISFRFFPLLIEVFGTAGFQGHFSYISILSSTEEVYIFVLAVCLCVVCFFETVLVILLYDD